MDANANVGRKLDLIAGGCLVAHPASFHTLFVLVNYRTRNSCVVPFKITTSSAPVCIRVRRTGPRFLLPPKYETTFNAAGFA